MVDPVQDDAERGDAPRDSAAHSRVRYHKEFDGYAFCFYSGKRQGLRIQTTVKAAVNSRSEAARICRLCYLRCEEGWTREQILEYRNALYRRIGGTAPKQPGAPRKAGRPPKEPEAPLFPAPQGEKKSVNEEVEKEKEMEQEEEDKEEEEEEDDDEEDDEDEVEEEEEEEEDDDEDEVEEKDVARSEAEGEGGSGQSEAAEVAPEGKGAAKRSGQLAEKPELTPVISEDAPQKSRAHRDVRFQSNKGVFYFDVKAKGKKLRLQTTTRAAGGCHEDAARIARLCYHRMVAMGEPKQAVLAYRKALYERCAEMRSPPPPVAEEEDEEAGGGATAHGGGSSLRTPDSAASQLCKKRRRLSEIEIVCRSLVDKGETVLVTPNKVARKSFPALAQLEASDIEQFTTDEIYYYERILGLSCRRQREDRITRLERLAQRNTLPGRQASQERLSSIQAFLARPEAERRAISVNELKRLERCAFIPDSENLSLPERKLRVQEQLWASRSAKPEEAASSFFAGWRGTDEQAKTSSCGRGAQLALGP